ncbi:MAG TPA: hypothetical protein VGM87_15805 [Roseomonas sp.]|jgi:hypothetical protein
MSRLAPASNVIPFPRRAAPSRARAAEARRGGPWCRIGLPVASGYLAIGLHVGIGEAILGFGGWQAAALAAGWPALLPRLLGAG